MQPGGTATYSLVAMPGNGFGGVISFACEPEPAFISCEVSPGSIDINPQLPLLPEVTITASSSLAVPGIYRLTIVGTSAGITRSTTVELVVR